MTGFRLPRGGRIDRGRNVGFTWDGTRHVGLVGDTVASALMAHGERVLGRSFKYHRPRGIMTAGIEEGGALVTLGRGAHAIPNVKPTQAEIHDGLEVHGQNAWPSVRLDLMSVNGLLGRFFGAGFYYKTFFGVTGRGTREWMFFERFIRRAAGMGTPSGRPDPDAYEIVNDHCDVLVVGSGPAGLAAAGTAASAGLDVVLAEQDFLAGGSIANGLTETIRRKPAGDWLAERLSALEAAGARVWLRTTAFGLYDHGVVGLLERVTDHLSQPGSLPRERLRILRAGRVVLATGAIERPFVFGANDRPGVMLASAAGTYVSRFAVAPGRRAVIATNNDSAYAAASTLARAGIETLLLDSRERLPDGAAETARATGVTTRAGAAPVEARGAAGVRGLDIGRRRDGGFIAEDRIECDLVGVSGGWTPVINLASHRGLKPVWEEKLSAFLIRDICGEPVTLAGAAAGQFASDAAVKSGQIAGDDARKAITGKRRPKRPEPATGWERPLEPLWEVRDPERHAKGFVDPQNDVTADDVRLAHREGFVAVEHLKRYTTLGMATDQGKFGNVVGLALMAEATGRPIPETGTTTFRPPYTPVSIGSLAGMARGRHWTPTRHTPMLAEHDRLGPVWVDAGLWKRAWYYPRTDETMEMAVRREASVVRNTVGMVDVSTLGKIMVQGPDAGEFLERVYSNPFARLPVGKARYGLMLRDDGIVLDDGTTWRLSETDWFLTTTTANAGAVMLHLSNLLQTRWPELRVHVTSVSDHWGGVAIAGPRARTVLDGVCPDIDFSDDAFPFMGVRRGEMRVGAGETIPVMSARLSFSGELAWEVMCPADFAPAMWETLMIRVRAEGGVPYGLEALDCLRVEKGHVTGRELDGRTTAQDVGLGTMASTRKQYIGRVLAGRPDLARADRPRLVGLVPVESEERVRAGAVLLPEAEATGHGIGWVSSVADSPTLGHWIGLGFVAGGLAEWAGHEIVAASPVDGESTRVRVVSQHFFDPDGSRMHG
jgi:sarcosine oxidase subunit alpha